MLPAILLMIVTLALASRELPRLQTRSVELSAEFAEASRAAGSLENRPEAPRTAPQVGQRAMKPRRPGYRFVLPSDAARVRQSHREVITLRPSQ